MKRCCRQPSELSIPAASVGPSSWGIGTVHASTREPPTNGTPTCRRWLAPLGRTRRRGGRWRVGSQRWSAGYRSPYLRARRQESTLTATAAFLPTSGLPAVAVGGGGDDCYSGRPETPGGRVGSGAEALGLSGRVSPEQFGALNAGLDPGEAGVRLRASAQDPGGVGHVLAQAAIRALRSRSTRSARLPDAAAPTPFAGTGAARPSFKWWS